jgi:DNA-directed RNA polymerase I, II, and III subunit RPABC2
MVQGPLQGDLSESAVKKVEERLKGFKVTVGPPHLTRFERARIIGVRALQLALGAPPFISVEPGPISTLEIAGKELEARALPISIRRTLPDGRYQDIPLDALLEPAG